MRYNFSFDRSVIFNEESMLGHLGVSIFEGLYALLPIFAVLLVAAILGPIALGGWNFSLKTLAPKASRMNPISGLSRMFGAKALMELAKAIGKVVIVAAIALTVLAINTEEIMAIRSEPLLRAMLHSVTTIGWAVLFISCAMIIITMVDIPFQIHDHSQKLKMTLQQVKDEMKDTDGRPEVKQKIRQLQQQMAQNRMMADVPEADVVITNPQHYSVALSYDQSTSSAPLLLAKGGDHMAMRIREVARENSVPIITSAALARAIYFNTDIGDEIPAGLYVAVAQLLAYIYQLRQFVKSGGKRPVLPSKPEIPDELRHT